MRILHSIMTRKLFGSERHVLALAEAQAALGHEVHIAAPRALGLSRLAARAEVHDLWPVWRGLSLARLTARLKPDVLHAHLSRACKAAGRMAQVRAHDGPAALATLHLGYKPQQHARLDALIALTAAERERAIKAGFAGPVAAIGSGLMPAAHSHAETRAKMRAEFGVGPATCVIGYCGRLHASKGPALLVEAFQAAGLADAALVLAGSGPEEKHLASLAARDPRIKLLGYRDDAAALYHGFDLFVLPSQAETFALVLVEAMAAGCPIASTATDGARDVLAGTDASLFAPGDKAALIAILRAAFARGQRRVSYDLSRFDPAAQAQKVLAFYEDAVRARRLRLAPGAAQGAVPV